MRANVVAHGGGDDLQQWFRDIPIVTKVLCGFAFFFAFTTSFKIISPGSLVFISDLVRNKFEIWRMFTPFLFCGGFSFQFAMHLMILYENCKRYEANPYNTGAGGNSADFIYMIVLSAPVFLTIAHFYNFYILSQSLLYMIIYVWSRREPDAQLNIMGVRFKAIYLPWIYELINMVMAQDIVMPLIGIAVGHVYYYFVVVMPIAYGRDWVKTPQFCIDILHWYTGGMNPAVAAATTGVAPPPNRPVADPTGAPRGGRPATQGSGYAWGRGHVLGAATG